ncbi:hypothetical protein C4572_03345 [Candidatus Parcubacteria bacterium]|nr:MAG: hypothetical protein C4572_03345 [Candidatus Parcubacteria bacterium]
MIYFAGKKYLIFSLAFFALLIGFLYFSANKASESYNIFGHKVSFLKRALAVAPGCTAGSCLSTYCASGYDPGPYCVGGYDPGPYCVGGYDPGPYCVGGFFHPRFGFICTRAYDPPFVCTQVYDPPFVCTQVYDPPFVCTSTACGSYSPDICPLSVSKTGSGSVTGPGVNCGGDCNESYNLNTSVSLSPSSSSGYLFAGWEGACTGLGSCSFVMNAAKSVMARFNPVLYVNKNIVAAGAVVSSPAGISCGTTCGTASAAFSLNSSISLTATAAPGYVFAGWSGAACSGTGSCVVTMNAAKSVTAQFNMILILDKSSPGAGVVTSNPAGISCGTTCKNIEAGFPVNSTVTLIAAPSQGYRLAGWRGACDFRGSGPCVITMNGSVPKATVAIFEVLFSAGKAGPGSGVVVSPGVECGSDCSEYYPDGFSIPILANPFINSYFAGWQGNCAASKDNVCLVQMSAPRSITAVFDILPYLFKMPDILPNLYTTKKISSNATVFNPVPQAPLSGEPKPVSLSVSGLPTGATATVSNNNCVAPCSSSVNISVSPNAPAGIYPITVTGQSGSVATTSRFALFINEDNLFSVKVEKKGDGHGTVRVVSSDPLIKDISCYFGSLASGTVPACSNSYLKGSNFIVSATASTGSVFAGWGGACSGTGPCSINGISSGKNITANFKKQ